MFRKILVFLLLSLVGVISVFADSTASQNPQIAISNVSITGEHINGYYNSGTLELRWTAIVSGAGPISLGYSGSFTYRDQTSNHYESFPAPSGTAYRTIYDPTNIRFTIKAEFDDGTPTKVLGTVNYNSTGQYYFSNTSPIQFGTHSSRLIIESSYLGKLASSIDTISVTYWGWTFAGGGSNTTYYYLYIADRQNSLHFVEYYSGSFTSASTPYFLIDENPPSVVAINSLTGAQQTTIGGDTVSNPRYVRPDNANSISLGFPQASDAESGLSYYVLNISRADTGEKLITDRNLVGTNITLQDTELPAGVVLKALVHAVDKFHNAASDGAPFYFLIDTDAPSVVAATTPTLVQSTTSGNFDQVNLSWSASSDTGSGIAGYEVWYRTRNGSAVTSIFAVANANLLAGTSGTVTINADRNSDTEYELAVVPVDQVGNRAIDLTQIGQGTSPYPTVQIQFPRKIGISNVNSFLQDAQQPATTGIEVDLTLNITAALFQANYQQIKFKRLSVAGHTPLTAGLANQDIVIDSSNLSQWSVDSQGYVMVRDILGAETGAGHKTLQYAIYEIPQGSNSTSFEPGANNSQPLTLANHPGNVVLNVYDMADHEYSTTGFQVYPDRKLKISFQGNDPDQDHWDVEIDKITKVRGSTATLSNYLPISGNTALAYDYQNTGYAEERVPVTLSEGINYVCLSWQEDRDVPVYYSAIKAITLTKQSGGYRIDVADIADDAIDTTGGIVVRPGEPLHFAINANAGSDTPSVSWDFGDGSPAVTTLAVDYKYHQASDQTSDALHYTLSLAVSGEAAPLTLPVTVQDTQEGTLYESEIWHGDHLISGIVEVPTGLQLTLEPSITVQFKGGIGAGYRQGMVINGAFMVGDATVFKKADGQTEGWNTIKIAGSATIGTAQIQDADRALTVAPGARVSLSGTTVTGNLTGIHLVGSSQTTLTNCHITNNSLFGVKEDAQARPTLIGTVFTNNFRNYYQWDGGVLSIAEINALPTNTGNQGE